MIRNDYRGRCACGAIVQPQQGFVSNRKIVCSPCAPPAPAKPVRQSPPFSVAYQGCDDRESMSEYFYDNFHSESDFVGWDVGAQ